MRSKMKYMAVVAIVVVCVLAIVLVSCSGSVTDETQKWLESAKNATVTDVVTLENLELKMPEAGLIGGSTAIVKLDSLELKVTRNIVGNKLNLDIELQNINGIKFTKLLDSILPTITGALGIKLNLDKLGDISLKISLNYDPDSNNVLTGEFHGYSMKSIVDTLPEGDSNPDNDKFLTVTKDQLDETDNAREIALINAIVDLLDNPVYGPAQFNKDGTSKSDLTNIISIANLALEKFGDDKINGSEYTAKTLIDMIFGSASSGKIGNVINGALNIKNLKMTDNETQKIGGKNVFKSTTMTAGLSVKLTKAQVKNLADNIGNVLGALGVQLDNKISEIIGQILKGEITINGKVNVVSTYTENK